MSLTFFYAPMSTASTVHWSLEELAIPYEAVRVDLKDPADKKAKLGPVNPNLRVPVLVHDGVAIFESVAIQIYLGETFGVDAGLYPAPGPERGRALKWLVWTNVSLGEAVLRFLRNTSDEYPKEQQNAAAGRAAPTRGAAATNANSRRAAPSSKWRRRRRRAARARARAEPHGVAAFGLGVRRWWCR